jgi:Family of unknown function (DUF6232)
MTRLFHEEGLQITDEWIRTPFGTYAIADVRAAWVTRHQISRGSRMLTAALGAGFVLVLVGGVGVTGWFNRNWVWLLASPVVFFLAASIGLFDPVAIYLEKRHHELWITTGTTSVLLWKANYVEARKALRQIQRARERHHERYEV